MATSVPECCDNCNCMLRRLRDEHMFATAMPGIPSGRELTRWQNGTAAGSWGTVVHKGGTVPEHRYSNGPKPPPHTRGSSTGIPATIDTNATPITTPMRRSELQTDNSRRMIHKSTMAWRLRSERPSGPAEGLSKICEADSLRLYRRPASFVAGFPAGRSGR